jgi:hypothetical protein
MTKSLTPVFFFQGKATTAILLMSKKIVQKLASNEAREFIDPVTRNPS